MFCKNKLQLRTLLLVDKIIIILITLLPFLTIVTLDIYAKYNFYSCGQD